MLNFIGDLQRLTDRQPAVISFGYSTTEFTDKNMYYSNSQPHRRLVCSKDGRRPLYSFIH
jgi:hypothetical protein